jgi:uncharacterized protein YhfF
MKITKEILSFWEEFLKSTESNGNCDFEIDEYGDNPKLRDELVGLILEGKKTASCGSLFHYEYDGDPLPVVGGRKILVDGSGAPVCVVETTEVFLEKFKNIKEDFAYEEGEGDRSLANWREGHWRYFSRVLSAIGGEVSEDMMLVCERFKMIYKSDANKASERNAEHAPRAQHLSS